MSIGFLLKHLNISSHEYKFQNLCHSGHYQELGRFLLVGKLLCANINSCELVEMAEGHIGGWDQERLSHLFQTHKNRPFQIFGNSANTGR